MKTPFPSSYGRTVSCALVAFVMITAASLRAETTAIATRVFNGYKRTHLADGAYRPETYAFANGGCWDSVAGDSIADLPFRQLAGTLAAPMAKRGYVSASDPSKTDLLIFVLWGSTRGSDDSDPAMESLIRDSYNRVEQLRFVQRINAMRETDQAHSEGMGGLELMASRTEGRNQLEGLATLLAMQQRAQQREDVKNAMILGYQDDLLRASDLNFFQFGTDLYNEIRIDRYFVVLKAYDFQLAWKEKRPKILWEARFSVPRQGTDFVKVLPAMAQYAASYLGTDTKGIIRDRLPDVQINYGESKVLEYETAR